MDPDRGRGGRKWRGLPRTRGDGPARGRRADVDCSGFPAHAGMDPRADGAHDGRTRLPRTRGDGPGTNGAGVRTSPASPHTRGWTRSASEGQAGPPGFPAHAGMDPRRPGPPCAGGWLPRTRGDGPRLVVLGVSVHRASPHTRGWTSAPANAAVSAAGFPAHAGMDPRSPPRRRRRRGLPRTRGDGPASRASCLRPRVASPHTRGWTRWILLRPAAIPGFPAHAGMDPRSPCSRPAARWLPRTRGDGPLYPERTRRETQASPHTRGWTPARGGFGLVDAGFPAHAGMDPSRSSRSSRRRRLPRTRGDGPFLYDLSDRRTEASPHTRGWTQ